MNTDTDQRIPVTILTGFLGSGKTTLLNRILTEKHGRRIAVIENEFGEIGIDDALVIQAEEEVFEMNNGCICCTVRGDLIRILGNLQKRRHKFDYILVETTGLADPGPVAQTFFVDDEVKQAFRLDGIVTLVDARHVWHHIDESDECRKQIAFADRILINKTDLATPEEIQRVENRIRAMNRVAPVYRTRQAELAIDALLGIRAFELDQKLEVNADFLKPEMPFEWAGVFELPAGGCEWVFQKGPDPEMGMVVLPIASRSQREIERANKEAMMLFRTHGKDLAAGETLSPGSVFYNLVLGDSSARFGMSMSRPGFVAVHTQHMPEEFQLELQSEKGVVAPVHSEEFAAGHTHDNTVSSVGIRMEGTLHADRLNEWLSTVLREQGADIFRMKGILNIQGSSRRFVFQGVHMLFDGKPDRPWEPGESRTNRLVFIGRNLDREALNAGFRKCAFTSP